MDERIIVRVVKSGKVIKTYEYSDYDTALDFVLNKLDLIFDRVYLLRYKNKQFVCKTTVYPQLC